MTTPDVFDSNEAAPQRLLVPTEIPTAVCRCCGNELPVSQFYSNGTHYYKRCKSCMAAARRLTKIYNKNNMMPVEQWPQELLDLVALFQVYKNAGGKIDYSTDSVMEALERYNKVKAEDIVDYQELIKQKGLEEVVNVLLQQVNECKDSIKHLQDDLQMLRVSMANKSSKSKAESEDYEVKQRRRRADLLNKINSDKRLKQYYSPMELGDLIQCFKDAYNAIQQHGYLPPTELWHLVAMLEMKEQPLTIEMETFYEDFLKPGIEAAKLREDYGLMQGDVVDHVFGDYYDLDWHGIPYKFE